MIVSKTRNATGWATKADNLIPNGVKCNENVIWVSVLRLSVIHVLPWLPGSPRSRGTPREWGTLQGCRRWRPWRVRGPGTRRPPAVPGTPQTPSTPVRIIRVFVWFNANVQHWFGYIAAISPVSSVPGFIALHCNLQFHHTQALHQELSQILI